MRNVRTGTAAALFVILAAAPMASAQTADEIVEKSIAAMGGRAAMAKIKSRRVTGTIVLSTPAGDISGSIEVLGAVPNKSRSLVKADLSSLGMGLMTIDQRFDGHAGYVIDSLQGNRELSGGMLDNMKNGSFPHPFLNYKDLGTTARVSGKEKVGDRDTYVLVFDPTAGSEIRQYIDAETFLPLKMSLKVEVPQLGQELEQTTEFLDYKEVDGVKIPLRLRVASSVQSFTISDMKVEHNVAVDDALFAKPAGR